MSVNKNRKSPVMRLLITAVIVFFSGVADHKAAGKLSSTDDELEQKLATLMKKAEGQQRETLVYNAILARVARQKAYDMGKRGYFNHINLDGDGPNYSVTQGGYILPDDYGQEKSSNNIESISAGRETAEDVWNSWMTSRLHRTHLLGLSFMYLEQIEYGVGHAFVADSKYQHYWVVITAKPGESNKTLPVAKSRVP